MRALNQRLVLDRLRAHGEATRPRIAADTGLSKPTVGQALVDLEQHGLVRTTGRSLAGPGRAAVVYQAAPDAGHVVGVDIGRRVLRIAVADLEGSIVARLDEPNRCRSASALVRTVSESVERAVSSAGLLPHEVVSTVVGTPGVPDPATGTVHRAPNLPGWERRGLLHELASALAVAGSDVVVENDANLCAVGEHALGAALGVDVLVCLTVGTGIGMGLLVDGKLFRGAHGAAGEIADLPFGPLLDRGAAPGRGLRHPESTAAPSGADARRPGPVETAAAGQAVVAAARARGVPKARSAKDVFRLARAGDPRALAVVEEEAEKLAYVVAAVAAVLDPRLIVLGGGIGGNADLLAGPMRRALATTTPVVPDIVAGRLGEDAVLAGAIATALSTAHELVFDRRGLRRAAGDA
ncbi:ROK family protein [Amycolatopsis sp. DG1A-15b]|uniref:ROK family transcriptional regulator n=1 Tax=Amycolatopsis sp. DG1A-15b TaxID=3052846 RepID=UPI00255B5FB4|nr:ROK family protein [Amycolatopsis sp. DG1A-15b]WIX93354.1 ROK family protein [Amycolatopsis sp. DG1A-15b]